MKSILIIILAIVSLILEPFCGWGEMVPITSNDPPPVAQPLVREGDFAVGLVKALNLGTPQDEADAENTLISHNIAPKNG